MMNSIEDLLQTPCWVIDIFPMRVPEDSPGQFFAVEGHYLREHMASVKRKHVDLVLKLNCYAAVSIDGACNPAPARIEELMRERAVYIMLGGAMLLSEPDDTHMTLFNPDARLLRLVQTIAQGEGLFVWEGRN